MRRILFRLFLVSSVVLLSCKTNKELFSYVNPFVGTGGHGHTFPGATLPFGMVQLSPDTGVWMAGIEAAVATIELRF